MKTSIEFQLDKLSEIDLKEDSLINIHIRCDQGVREKLIISHNDLVLSCYMIWNQGSFDLKLNKKKLIQILNKKRFDEINSEDFTDLSSDIELDQTKDGQLDVQSLNGVEKTEDQINILNESGNYNFKIDEENIDDVLYEIYSDGDIDESDYEFTYGLNVSNIKINNEILFNSDVFLEYEGITVGFILFTHCFFTKSESLDDTKTIIGNAIMEVVDDDELYQKCWGKSYELFEDNEGWDDLFEKIELLRPNLTTKNKSVISSAIFKINNNNQKNSNDYDKSKVCKLISDIDFSRDSNDSSHSIKLDLNFGDIETTPEHILDSEAIYNIKSVYKSEIYSRTGGFDKEELNLFIKININSKSNPIYDWLKECFIEADGFYFEKENESGANILYSYGIIDYNIIDKDLKLILDNTVDNWNEYVDDLSWFLEAK